MKRILLYSPDVIGHPRVYCRVIADALQTAACEVVVAMGFTDNVGLNESPDLQPLSSRSRLHLVDNRRFSRTGDPHLTAEELVALQTHFAIDTTLFIEADKSNEEFRRIAAGEVSRLRGRALGIFSNTAEWYPGEDSYTGEPRRLVADTVRTTLGNIKRAIFNRKQSVRFFYENVIIKPKVLDEVLVKDERLAAWRGPPVYWMPEISRPAATPETAAEKNEFEQRQKELARFLSVNEGREPVLYFGDAAYYKGYDLFLEFIANTPGICAIHAGRTYEDEHESRFRMDVDLLRLSLKRGMRLYETNDYVHTQRLKELFFGAIRLYITTHRLTLSSSTIIQAIELGKPVLVPDRGLLGHRVTSNGLGDVYRYGDIIDLRRKAEQLWNEDLTRFNAQTRSFWERFSDRAIHKFFVQRLVNPATY